MFAPFYHVGIVVPELGEAKRDLASSLGLSWAEEMSHDVPMLIDGAIHQTRRMTYVYSRQGPPYVELVQAGAAPWEVHDGVHHVGYWTEDVVADVERLAADNHRVLVSGRDASRGPARFAYLRSPTGLIVELVDQRSRASILGPMRADTGAAS